MTLIIAYILIILVALEYFYIMYLEMFVLNDPKARQIFNLDEPGATNRKIQLLFANQGLYNVFLAAGIIFLFAFNKVRSEFLFNLRDCRCSLWGSDCKNKEILIKQRIPAVLASLR
ncbi:DUF1304 domain-containing protein [Actinobacillus seminis]